MLCLVLLLNALNDGRQGDVDVDYDDHDGGDDDDDDEIMFA